MADKVEVRLVTEATEVPFSLSKVYSDTCDSTFKMPSLISGSKKEAIFLLNFHPTPQQVPENAVIHPVRAFIRYQLVSNGAYVDQDITIPIQVKNSDFQGEIVVDEDVMVNFYRVKAADIMKQASELGDQGQYEAARTLLEQGSIELANSVVAGNQLIQVLSADLRSSMGKFADHHSWNVGGGKAAMKSKARGHQEKRGMDVDMYRNCAQMSMNVKAKSAIKKS